MFPTLNPTFPKGLSLGCYDSRDDRDVLLVVNIEVTGRRGLALETFQNYIPMCK